MRSRHTRSTSRRLLRDEQRAMEAKSNHEPLKFVSIQADAESQTAFALPMLSPVTHGTDREEAERQNIMGRTCGGTVYGGFSHVTESWGRLQPRLHRRPDRLFKLGEQPFIHHLTIQVDNACSEKTTI